MGEDKELVEVRDHHMHETSRELDTALSRTSKRKKMVAVVPSLLTLGNVACGFGCITYAAKVGPETDVPNHFYIAAVLIFAGMLLDALDGPVARLAKQTSQFGAQLDSLADAITFGVAPAFLMLTFSRVFHPRVLWLIATLYVLCTVLRLARFNVTNDDDPSHESFCGLPSPAAAGMVASLVFIGPGLMEWTNAGAADTARELGEFLTKAILPVMTLVVACLMVSRVRYPHVFNQLVRRRHSFQYLVKLIFAIVIVSTVKELAIPIVICYFVLASPLRALWSQVVRRRVLNRPEPASS